MKVKAIKSFVGVVCMNIGDVKTVSNEVGLDLVRAGLAVAVEEPVKKPKTEPKVEAKADTEAKAKAPAKAPKKTTKRAKKTTK